VSKHVEDAMPTYWTTRAPFALGTACASLILLGSTGAAAQSSNAHSPDERQLAWSARTAGHDRIDAAQPMLEQIVAERIDTDAWSPPVDYALDALIQLEARLTPDLLARIVEQRPVEGLILLSVIDDGTVDGVLLDTLGRERGFEWFAAANLLAVRRPAGYAAQLLSGLRIRTRITVSDSGESSLEGGTAGGIACGIFDQRPGMPPWPSYHLTTYARAGVAVLATGPTPVYYERRVTRAGSRPSRGRTFVDGPTGADRLRYIEALTGRTTALTDGAHRTVRRRPGLDIAAVSTQFRRDIEQQHAGLLRDLVAAGFLTAREADGLPVEMDVTVVGANDPR
jgi:hypothetical protein